MTKHQLPNTNYQTSTKSKCSNDHSTTPRSLVFRICLVIGYCDLVILLGDPQLALACGRRLGGDDFVGGPEGGLWSGSSRRFCQRGRRRTGAASGGHEDDGPSGG